jgi:hypothetical protein
MITKPAALRLRQAASSWRAFSPAPDGVNSIILGFLRTNVSLAYIVGQHDLPASSTEPARQLLQEASLRIELTPMGAPDRRILMAFLNANIALVEAVENAALPSASTCSLRDLLQEASALTELSPMPDNIRCSLLALVRASTVLTETVEKINAGRGIVAAGVDYSPATLPDSSAADLGAEETRFPRL